MDTSSWLGKAVSRYSRSLSPEDGPSRSKPPRWRTPSPMAASMIPPPIVASVYSKESSTKSAIPEASAAQDDLSFFRRKQKQLEADLQILLDAQAEGLLSGLGTKPSDDDNISTGSSTPTALSSNLRSVRSGTSAMQRRSKISLREARRGLHASMRKLALLKVQEFEYLAPELDECEAVVSQLEDWQHKKERLEERTRQIHQGDEHRRARELRQKADDMQNDINDLEARLAQMKTQQRKLRREALDCENEIDAKLSSYTASLGILESNSKDYLADLQRTNAIPSVVWSQRHASDQVTLDIAQRDVDVARKRLGNRQKTIEKEREALEEGAVMWRDVVKEVSEFERRLREDMARLSSRTKPKRQTPQGPADERELSPESNDRAMKELLGQLDQTTTQLESKYKLAQTRDWKLLVAAIGAELEAFLKGKDILEAALEAAEEASSEPSASTTLEQATDEMGNQSVYDEFRTPRSSVIRHADGGEAIRDLDQAFEADKNGSGHDNVVSSDTDNESDGPDPELLISHQDTDTE